MSKLRPRKAAEVVRVLEKLGFTRIRQSGSHAIFHHTDGRWTTVPIHESGDVGRGILRKIIKDIGITVDEFENLK